jgi:hypothetical protein
MSEPKIPKINELTIKPRLNPLIADLPEHLKNPANYDEIQAKIIASVQTSCTHSDVFEMAKCEKCTKKMLNRRKLLKSLGFKNPRQYMEWRKTHEEIKKRYPLVDWKRKKLII